MVIVLFSGGIGSWAAARRLVDDGEQVELLFTDTLIEDEDVYRFISDATTDLDVPLHRLTDGRTPWELFNDEKLIGNTRADLCSRVLKRELSRKWIDERWPDGATVAMGIDWSEAHRFERARPRWEPHTLIAPLTRDVAILRDRRGGETQPFTLRQLRERYETQPEQLDLLDMGGCGCMVDDG